MAKGGTGKEEWYYFLYQVPTSILLRETASCVPEIWRRMYDVVPREPKVSKKRDGKSDFHVAKKGVKKRVSSNFVKILEKESSN